MPRQPMVYTAAQLKEQADYMAQLLMKSYSDRDLARIGQTCEERRELMAGEQRQRLFDQNPEPQRGR